MRGVLSNSDDPEFVDIALDWYDDLSMLDQWIVQDGPEDGGRVHPGVTVETLVFGGYESFPDQGRDLLQGGRQVTLSVSVWNVAEHLSPAVEIDPARLEAQPLRPDPQLVELVPETVHAALRPVDSVYVMTIGKMAAGDEDHRRADAE